MHIICHINKLLQFYAIFRKGTGIPIKYFTEIYYSPILKIFKRFFKIIVFYINYIDLMYERIIGKHLRRGK